MNSKFLERFISILIISISSYVFILNCFLEYTCNQLQPLDSFDRVSFEMLFKFPRYQLELFQLGLAIY